MRLFDLLHEVTPAVVVDEIVAAYPNEDRNRDGYRDVIGQLRAMAPVSREDMTIVVSRRRGDEVEPEPFWDVSGVDAEGTRWGLCFTPWAEWLAMPVRVEGCDLTPEQAVGHILWEMTFHGFTDDEVQEDAEELREAVKDLKEKLADLSDSPTDEQLTDAGFHVWRPRDDG